MLCTVPLTTTFMSLEWHLEWALSWSTHCSPLWGRSCTWEPAVERSACFGFIHSVFSKLLLMVLDYFSISHIGSYQEVALTWASKDFPLSRWPLLHTIKQWRTRYGKLVMGIKSGAGNLQVILVTRPFSFACPFGHSFHNTGTLYCLWQYRDLIQIKHFRQ